MLRFNHLFAGLLGVSFLTAFVMPASMTSFRFGQVQGLLAPVSRPVRLIAAAIYHRAHQDDAVVDPESPAKPREQQGVYEENDQLRSAFASLAAKFDQLSQLNADRQAVGDIRSLCKPATVSASDPSALGFRESLTIASPVSAAAMIDRPVIRGNPSQTPLPCDLVGRVVQNGLLGAQVRLVTDPASVLAARIGRYEIQSDGHLKLVVVDKLNPLVRGIGHNQMTISSNLSMKEVKDAGIAVGDLVLLDDRDWPRNIQGFSVGKIVSIGHQPKSALLANIVIEPSSNLMRLSEVMVMVRD